MKKEDLAYCDTETTGLDRDRHEIWEVALITHEAGEDVERLWHLPVDLGRADSVALGIGRFHERYGKEQTQDLGGVTPIRRFATEFAKCTRGKHLVGAVVSFDELRLHKLLRENGACPEWHYHILDIEAIMLGYLFGGIGTERFELPYKSESLFKEIGVDVDDPQFSKHTALGDARLVKAAMERLFAL